MSVVFIWAVDGPGGRYCGGECFQDRLEIVVDGYGGVGEDRWVGIGLGDLGAAYIPWTSW